MKIKTGSKAPDFSLNDQDGNTVQLKDMQGDWILLYFYPKDDTPGCTTEACGLRDNMAKYKKAGIRVVGVSVDSIQSHKKFIKKYDLPITLLADEEKKIVKEYGLWVKKKFMGKEFMGTQRSSFLIDSEGKIAKVYEKVKPDEHAEEVLADVARLMKQDTKEL